jgi:hypothetical protein
MKYLSLLLLIFVIAVSCNNYQNAFESLISKKEIDCFPSVDLEGLDCIDNNNYKIIYNSGTRANSYLISRLTSDRKTKWTYATMPFFLTEGDIALLLLMDINNIDFMILLPKELENEYKKHGALCWWSWIHENDRNRNMVIKLLNDEIKIK